MKSWYSEIQKHIEKWSSTLNSSYWPKFVYHFTDITNAVEILKNGEIFSRGNVLKSKLDFTDTASASVISGTPAAHQNYVRFYYAPRTPTQFVNEGIRPEGERGDAHCPVPIFFAFDAKHLMGMDNAEFANGNMGSSLVEFGPEKEDFLRIPFDKVFHRSWFSQEERDEIIFHRHAELLIPERISLKPYLSWVGCRSHAERFTLLHMLGEGIPEEYKKIVRVTDSTFYEKEWSFVKDVTYENKKLVFTFNPNTASVAKFDGCLELIRPDKTFGKIEKKLKAKSSWTINTKGYDFITVKLVLDGALAYWGTLFSNDDVPF